MRVFVFLGVVILSLVTARAQSFTKYSWGLSAHGLVTGAVNTSSSDAIVSGEQTYAEYADSVSSHEEMRVSMGATAWFHAFINKQWSLQAGVGYIDLGFQRTQRNIQYMDPLFPGIGQGRLLEKSGGSGEKSIAYKYRYQYLQIPVLMHYDVYKSKDFYYKVTVCGGAGLDILLNHEITAKLSQFVVEGEDIYHLDSTGYEGSKLSLTLMAGAKGEYRLDKKTIIYVMPMLGFNPISVSKTPIHSYPYYFQVNFGFQYALDFSEERGK